jgi:molybdopterin/thiamine biosynthesis adenylyltransferase
METTEETVKRYSMKVVIVGAGGLLYHCMPSLATLLRSYRRPDLRMELVIIDPDVVEEKNRSRQWGDVGSSKVYLAASRLDELGVEAYEFPEGYKKRVSRENLLVEKHTAMLVVICLPDNHLARAQVHKALWEEAKKNPEVEVWGLFAGNTANSGWCASSLYTREGILGDWIPDHRDVVDEAMREVAGETAGESCGMVEEEQEGQTIESNQQTGCLVVRTLLGLLVEGRAESRTWCNRRIPGEITPSGVAAKNKALGYMDRIPSMINDPRRNWLGE